MALDNDRIRYSPVREPLRDINYLGLLDEYETASIAVFYYETVLPIEIGQEASGDNEVISRRWADYRNECLGELRRREYVGTTNATL